MEDNEANEFAGNKNATKDVQDNNKNKKSRIKKKYVLIAVLAVIVIVVILELHNVEFAFTHVTTSDAFVDGNSAIVPIAPQVKGKAVKVYIRQNQYVRKGQPLFKIDQSDYVQEVNKSRAAFMGGSKQVEQISLTIQMQKAALAKARYGLKADEALEELDRQNYIRYKNLYEGKAASKLMFDEMATKYKMTLAKVGADEANLTQIAASISELKTALKSKALFAKTQLASYKLAKINLRRTIIYAPCDGYVAKKNVNVGSYVMPGIPYLNIVNLKKIWIVANFKESDVDKIKIGAPVIIKVDSYPDATFHGIVSSFQTGTGSVFSLLPPENATGNYIKVVQRVPVKINLSKAVFNKTPLYPGLSVEPYVKIEKKAK